MPIIEVQSVSKQFRARSTFRALLGRGGVADVVRGKRAALITALKDISFTVEPGEALGLIGANGSGKSTLLKIVSGVTLPTTGNVVVRGRVASLLELGAGFHPMLTGRENVYLNAGLLGVRHADVDREFDNIVAFSGLESFIDNPVDTYSSGMFVRLGFAVAVHTNPDIFLVDEVLSVGDEAFQRKCRARIDELKRQGKTFIFVSHDLGMVNAICDRVVLLQGGEMIARRTPSETIDYYLRQVGKTQDIHRLQDGPLEVILNNGRICLFYEQRECSAAQGFQVHLESMGAWHESVAGDWNIVERSAAHAVVRIRMARLPVVQIWRLRLEGGALRWDIALECERAFPLDDVEANLFFPPTFAQWVYGDMTGHFPDVLPADHVWTAVAPPNLQCKQAAALPAEGRDTPIPVVRFEPKIPSLRMQWLNADYGCGCRVLQMGARIPMGDTLREKGVHELMTLVIQVLPVSEKEALAATREAERTLTSGDLAAAFHQGTLSLAWRGEPITKPFHVSTGIILGNLLTESQNLLWGPVERVGDRLNVDGESRHQPFRQHWELEAVSNGVALNVWFDALEPLDVQEFRVSAHLRPDYDEWQTDTESGRFPPLDPALVERRAANRDFAPGKHVRALSPSLPSVTLESTNETVPFRMAALNSRYEHQSRVLLAFRVPEDGPFHLEPGRHLLFSGVVRTERRVEE